MTDNRMYPPSMGPRRSAETDLSAAQEVRALARELIVRRIMIVILTVVIAISLAVNSATVVAIRQQQVDRAPITDQIANCTTPGRPCYERGQDQLKEIIAQLNQNGAAIASCASGSVHVSFEEVVKCALAVLKHQPAVGPH